MTDDSPAAGRARLFEILRRQEAPPPAGDPAAPDVAQTLDFLRQERAISLGSLPKGPLARLVGWMTRP